MKYLLVCSVLSLLALNSEAMESKAQAVKKEMQTSASNAKSDHDPMISQHLKHAKEEKEYIWCLRDEADVTQGVSSIAKLLHEVVASNKKEVVDFFSQKTDVMKKDENGNTLLHLAVQEGSLPKVAVLIIKGADINAVNHAGQTPLHFAALKNSVKIAELLVHDGADINAKDKNGFSPYLLASQNNANEIKEFLYSKGAL